MFGILRWSMSLLHSSEHGGISPFLLRTFQSLSLLTWLQVHSLCANIIDNREHFEV